MKTTCPIITKPTDLHEPGAIDQLIAFHRQTFGGWTMEDSKDEPNDEPKDEPKDVDRGYPASTAVAEMKPDEQAAYWRYHAQKHETAWKGIVGELTPQQFAQQQEELERLRAKDRTEAENAVEDAKKSTRAEVVQQFGPKLAAAEFRAALTHIEDEERRDTIIATLDLAKFVNDNGDVDTDKVKSMAAALAPADTGAGSTKEKKDFGAGRRQSGSSTGVNNGRGRYQERHGKTADA